MPNAPPAAAVAFTNSRRVIMAPPLRSFARELPGA
jgi:hypothetical protein